MRALLISVTFASAAGLAGCGNTPAPTSTTTAGFSVSYARPPGGGCVPQVTYRVASETGPRLDPSSPTPGCGGPEGGPGPLGQGY
jgi:hypothetical protein